MAKKVKVPIVKHESIVSIEISGAFFQDMQDAYAVLMNKIPKDDLKDCILAISKQQINSLPKEKQPDAVALETILRFIASAEKAFKDKGLIQDHEVELPNED